MKLDAMGWFRSLKRGQSVNTTENLTCISLQDYAQCQDQNQHKNKDKALVY
jgi:protein subunit release factor A